MNPTRLARLLAERLDQEGERVGAALTVGELLDRYVPYEVARGSLELTTKSEYDLLVLEFLADRRLTVLRDPAVGEAAEEELETPEPDLTPLEEHRGAALRLDLATISGGYRGSEPGEATAGTGPTPGADAGPPAPGEAGEDEEPSPGTAWDPTGGVEARPTPEEEPVEAPTADAQPETQAASGPAGATGPTGASEPAGEPDEPECRDCGRSLPLEAEVPVRFCPHCGTARPDRSCPECEVRLQPDWSYCPACGVQA